MNTCRFSQDKDGSLILSPYLLVHRKLVWEKDASPPFSLTCYLCENICTCVESIVSHEVPPGLGIAQAQLVLLSVK